MDCTRPLLILVVLLSACAASPDLDPDLDEEALVEDSAPAAKDRAAKERAANERAANERAANERAPLKKRAPAAAGSPSREQSGSDDTDPAALPDEPPAKPKATGAAAKRPAVTSSKGASSKGGASKGASSKGASTKGPSTKGSAPADVARLLQELQDPAKAESAYRRLWTIPRAAIPELIEEVENPRPSRVEKLTLLVVDPEFVGESKLFLATRLRGLGKMEEIQEVAPNDWRVINQSYTKMSYGIARNKKGYKVDLEKFGGFPIGVVVRAGLMNRFLSTRYPDWSDDDPTPGKLIEWWQAYYQRNRATLPPP